MIEILLIKQGDDSGRMVQHAPTLDQARKIIANGLPPTPTGYSYKIII